MRISKAVINSLLIFFVFVILLTVTTIVQAKQKSERAIREEVVRYELPFPGILPDNLLYPAKMARDRLWEFLISDLERKAYFEILMADKRVSAARILIEDKKGKTDLGISTFTKGYKYLEKTPPVIKALREKNYNTNNLIDKLEKACLKHLYYAQKFEKRKDLSQKQASDLKTISRWYRDLLPKVAVLR